MPETLETNQAKSKILFFRSAQKKTDVPLFAPADFRPLKRSARNTQHVYLAVLDIDNQPQNVVQSLLDRLSARGLALSFYTTFNHPQVADQGGIKCRILLELSRPVNAQREWRRFWSVLHADTDRLADRACKDPSRMYYLYASRPGEEGYHTSWSVEGAPLDVDEMLSRASVDPTTTGTAPLTPLDVQAHISELKGKHRAWGARLRQVLAGKPFAERGERDQVLNTLCRFYLAPAFPSASPEEMASLFRTSLEVMAREDPTCPTYEVALDKARRALEQHQEDLEEQAKTESDVMAERIADAYRFVGQERSAPVTYEEFNDTARAMGVHPNTLRRRLVLQCGKNFYFLVGDTYSRPITREEFAAAAPTLLAPLGPEIGIEAKTLTKQGARTRTPDEMIDQYGVVINTARVELSAQAPYLDIVQNALVEAPCPRRKLEAREHPHITEWLRLLAPDAHTHKKLIDWISVVTHLDEPCSALYLDGPPGSGKTLLAQGLSRIWTVGGPTALEAVFGAYNDALLQCPLVLADEQLPAPRSPRHSTTGELRTFIQAHSRPLNRKYLSTTQMIGCVRLVITANNRDLLTTNEGLTANDVQAITDRILYINATQESAAFLADLPAEKRQAMVIRNHLAEHALYLREEHKVVRGARFLVQGENSELNKTLTVGTGLRSAVCHWLVSYLLEPQRASALGEEQIMVHKGKLLVCPKLLTASWLLYGTNERPPRQGPVSKAVRGLSVGRTKRRTSKDRLLNYYVIDSELLIAWAEDFGVASRESILEALTTVEASRAAN